MNQTMSLNLTGMREWMIRAGFALIVMTLLIITGCDPSPTEVVDYEPEAQLTAFLHTGEAVDMINLHWVGRFNQYYDRRDLGIVNASVKIFPVKDADGSTSDTTGRVCYFTDHPDSIGDYVPTSVYIPEGMVRYRIEVRKPSDGINLWAETTSPDTFSFQIFQNGEAVDVDGDTLTREMPDLFIRWTESAGAEGYQAGILATGDPDTLLPLDPNFDPTDENQVEMYEDAGYYNYTVAPDYQLSMTIAWLFFTWEGPTRIDIRACSKEYYDYYFSSLMGGSQNPVMNVHGGVGMFGATAVNTFEVFMDRAEPNP